MSIEIKNVPTKNCIRILAFSDWRVQNYEDLLLFSDKTPAYDIVIYAGDDLDRLIEAKDLVEKVVSKSKSNFLLFVAGNDDIPSDRRILSELLFTHDLHESPFYYKDFVFIGVEGSTDGFGFIQYSENQVEEKLNEHFAKVKSITKRKNASLVLVSHTPPNGILDSAMRHSETGLARSIGSKSVRNFINKNKVSVTFCGHVHLFGGKKENLENGNCVINIASHDNLGAEGKIAMVDLSRQGKSEIQFHSTFDLYKNSELLKLSEVGHKRILQLHRNEIKNLSDITEENREKLKVRGVGNSLILKWIRQASLIISDFQGIEISSYQSMKFLTRKRHIIWDIETDLSQTHIWIIGAYDTLTNEMKQFFNPDDEKDCLIQFTDWLKTRPDAIPISFSGSRFDSRILSNSLKKQMIMDSTAFANRDIDLCIKVRYDCISTYSALALKIIAKEMGYKFRHPEIDGFYVGQVFSRYLQDSIKPKSWDDFIEYNEDDVLATLFVFNKLRELLKKDS